MIKAALLDLDGTLVRADMSVIIAEIIGKQDEVHQNNLNFHKGVTKGLSGLVASINLFKGITLNQIDEKLSQQDYLALGARELLKFFRDNGVILYETKKILEALGIDPSETIAVGDSPSDKSRFAFAATSIAVNPKGGIEEFADHVVTDDLRKVIPIVERLL